MYAELPRADVRELRRHVDLPFELSEGDGALRAWVELQDGEPRVATVDVALRDVALRLARDVEPLVFEQMEGRLEGQRDAEGGRGHAAPLRLSDRRRRSLAAGRSRR